MIKRFQAWRFERRRKLVEKWLADPRTGMTAMVNNIAAAQAMNMVTNWLNKKKILHCQLCPSTESLKKFAGNLFCPGHHAMVTEKFEQDQKTAAKEQASATVSNVA